VAVVRGGDLSKVGQSCPVGRQSSPVLSVRQVERQLFKGHRPALPGARTRWTGRAICERMFCRGRARARSSHGSSCCTSYLKTRFLPDPPHAGTLVTTLVPVRERVRRVRRPQASPPLLPHLRSGTTGSSLLLRTVSATGHAVAQEAAYFPSRKFSRRSARRPVSQLKQACLEWQCR